MKNRENFLKTAQKRVLFQRGPSLRTGGVAALWLLAFCLPAVADDGPFQLDAGHWMSYGHYSDLKERGLTPSAKPQAQPQQTPEATSSPSPAPAPSTATSDASTPAMAKPSRPIALPVMPGMDDGFNVQVNSTADSPNFSSAPPSAGEHAASTVHLSDENWQTPASVIENAKSAPQSDDQGDGDVSPLHVRMTFLPNENVTPVPSPESPSGQHLGHVMLEKKLAEKEKPAKTPEEAAACAAIDAYKKQQLEAIQSDRQTLKALQNAITALGLQKQLSFMTGDNSALTNAPMASDAPPANSPPVVLK